MRRGRSDERITGFGTDNEGRRTRNDPENRFTAPLVPVRELDKLQAFSRRGGIVTELFKNGDRFVRRNNFDQKIGTGSTKCDVAGVDVLEQELVDLR